MDENAAREGISEALTDFGELDSTDF